jgi:hypothetical protein
MYEIFLTSLFWFIVALIFAAIEIEAEGKYGWAEKMPTWYRTEGLMAKVYGLFMAKKPLTGYHSFMFFLPILLFHAHFFMGIDWSIEKELMAWALYFAFCPCWDFLWFVLNPHYSLENFNKKKVWWHSNSFWLFNKLPFDYVIGWTVSLLLGLLASWWGQNALCQAETFYRLVFFTGFTLVTIFFAPYYHNWYWLMRQRDDRDKIFKEIKEEKNE